MVQRHYGKAREYSREVLDQAQQITSSTEDPAHRNLLRDTLATRDQITADLAKGDALLFRKYSQSYLSSSGLRSIDGCVQVTLRNSPRHAEPSPLSPSTHRLLRVIWPHSILLAQLSNAKGRKAR